MLHEANADCQISKTNTNIKENHPCLLRHGIEINNKQSFISCLSDIIFFGKRLHDEDNKLTNKVAKILTIKEMKERRIKSISIDTEILIVQTSMITEHKQNLPAGLKVLCYPGNDFDQWFTNYFDFPIQLKYLCICKETKLEIINKLKIPFGCKIILF